MVCCDVSSPLQHGALVPKKKIPWPWHTPVWNSHCAVDQPVRFRVPQIPFVRLWLTEIFKSHSAQVAIGSLMLLESSRRLVCMCILYVCVCSTSVFIPVSEQNNINSPNSFSYTALQLCLITAGVFTLRQRVCFCLVLHSLFLACGAAWLLWTTYFVDKTTRSLWWLHGLHKHNTPSLAFLRKSTRVQGGQINKKNDCSDTCLIPRNTRQWKWLLCSSSVRVFLRWQSRCECPRISLLLCKEIWFRSQTKNSGWITISTGILYSLFVVCFCH